LPYTILILTATLGGGLGHLMRTHGLTVDNLLAVDPVTAEGARVRVDAQTEPELFWSLRGGDGNFGIATAFEYRLYRVGPLLLAGPIFWPLDAAARVLGIVHEFAAAAPTNSGSRSRSCRRRRRLPAPRAVRAARRCPRPPLDG
jgi:FAD/FMN-containing dehydrogenase